MTRALGDVIRGVLATLRRGAVPWVLIPALFLVLFLWLRGPHLLSALSFNPDEGELLASGKRATLSLLPYETFTASTHLFLWPMFLGAIGGLGLDLGLPLAHLLSGLIGLALIVGAWATLGRRLGPWFAFGALLAPAVYVFAGPHPDLISLGTELLPALFLLVAMLVIFGPRSPAGTTRLVVASALAGMSILAKPQGTLLAAAVVVLAILDRACRGTTTGVPDGPRWRRPGLARRLVIAAAAFVLPGLLALLVMAIGGTMGEFRDETVALLRDYVTQRETLMPAGVPTGWMERFRDLPTLLPICLLAPVLVAGDQKNGSVALPFFWSRRSPVQRRAAFGLVLLAATGIASSALSYPYFPHYGTWPLAGVLFGAMVATAWASDVASPEGPPPRLRRPSRAVAPLVAVIAFIGIAPAASSIFTAPAIPTGWSGLVDSSATGEPAAAPGAPLTLAAACPPGERVLVWGWAGEMYSSYSWMPASRYGVSIWQLLGTRNHDVYRSRLADELAADPPRCIIEALGPPFFYFGPEVALPTVIPSVQPFLNRCYRLKTAQHGAAPVRVYVRKPACGVSS